MLARGVPGAVRRWVRALAGVTTIAAVAVGATAGPASAAPPTTFTAISAGGGHTCVLTSSGGVECWGSNRFGQLGNGVKPKCNSHGRCTKPFSYRPVDVVGLSRGVKAIAAGGSHTCALTSAGGVKCWGYNASGQLGNGAKLRDCVIVGCELFTSPTPVDVVGLTSGVSAIFAGDFFTCAQTNGGSVKCWGKDQAIGGGHTSTPVDSQPAFDVAAYASGLRATAADGGHTCVVTSAGGVKCSGSNSSGELGNGSKAVSYTPVDVVGLAGGVRAITANGRFTCAIAAGGGAKCWGHNYFGTLGDGTRVDRGSPVDVTGMTSGVTAISAGVYHTCAIVGGRGVKCWGFNVDGRLGNRSAPRLTLRPVDVLFTAAPAAAPATPAAAVGPCSKAEATAVVKRLHLGNADDPNLSSPVAQVLCGAFLGQGSQAMVASLAIPSCGRTGGWVVFRRSGATWQIVMQRNNGADLDAVGTGIRETQFVLRPGDAHCFPTGGTRSRTWHWTGARFVPGAWTYSKPASRPAAPAGASTFGFFKTPSGNILCAYSYTAARTNLGCVVKSGLRPEPPPRRPGCSAALTVALRTTGRAFTTDGECPGEDAPETPYVGSGIAKVLPYGASWSGGGLRCASASTGLTCRNRSGHGFFLSREHWRAF